MFLNWIDCKLLNFPDYCYNSSPCLPESMRKYSPTSLPLLLCDPNNIYKITLW